jgi:Fe-S-cluster-containing dehydrogenase component/DMSO reductase anchor subunit
MPVELPLLEQPARHGFSLRVTGLIPNAHALMPGRAPRAGEQYRFHFDMAKCIGCKCCVVACNEQNGNPAELNWRRTGEIEGGVYPLAQRWHLSMGCNHCLEPSCMIGCPVEAYTKDAVTGIVDHNPDICIGCQYCTWNCSYGVPQYNPERGVVGKCDMCHGRLDDGLPPACVNACPEHAIAIEIVDMAEWRRNHVSADAPGLPSSADSLSTTRVSMPPAISRTAGRVDVDRVDLDRVDLDRVRPQDPHWSLVIVLVLTQLAVGVAATLWLLGLSNVMLAAWAGALPLGIAAFGLGLAPLHLGRPVYAWRAVRNWRRSWLSREVLALSLFAGAASVYAVALWLDLQFAGVAGAATLIAGLAGLTSSAKIYMVPARPAWNMPFTLSDFFLTAAVLGPRLVLAAGLGDGKWIVGIAIAASAAQLANSFARLIKMSRSAVHEMNASARLTTGPLRPALVGRLVCMALALALVAVSPIPAFLFALAAETLGRYLFFASVVPKSMASTYLTPKEAAA